MCILGPGRLKRSLAHRAFIFIAFSHSCFADPRRGRSRARAPDSNSRNTRAACPGRRYGSGDSGGINFRVAAPGASGTKPRAALVAGGIAKNRLSFSYKGADVASAATITPTGNLFHVTGTTTITSVSSTGVNAGTRITMIFDGVLTVTDGSNLKLQGNFLTAAESALALEFDGTNWIEICRSPGSGGSGTGGTGTTGTLSKWISSTTQGDSIVTEDANGIVLPANKVLTIGSDPVIKASKKAWDLPTGTLTRTAFDASTVTLSQLGERVAALITDLRSWHELLGPPPGPLLTDIVAYWKLDEAVDATRADSVGSNNLADLNSVAQATGKIGNAAGFDGTTKHLSIADNSDLSTGDIDFTFSGWVYLNSKASSQAFLGKNSAATGGAEYLLMYDIGADRFAFRVYRATDSSVAAVANTLGSPSTGTWYHITCWHDAAADTVNICVNNGAVDSVATGGALQASGAANFKIGAIDYSGFEYYVNGRVDEMGFWKKVLTSAERTALYAAGSGLSYPF